MKSVCSSLKDRQEIESVSHSTYSKCGPSSREILSGEMVQMVETAMKMKNYDATLPDEISVIKLSRLAGLNCTNTA